MIIPSSPSVLKLCSATMEQSQHLSSALRITNVNDFLAPTTSCVLPLGGGAVPAGSVLSPIIPTDVSATTNVTDSTATPTTTFEKKVAKITVSDCLSCSGCVTSSETILLSNENVSRLENFKSQHNVISVAIISQQSIASLAAHFDLSMSKTMMKISTFLKTQYNIEHIVDSTFAKYVSVTETSKQFISQFRKQQKRKPFITSMCPGWLTYAEKTQDEKVILSSLSTISSTQSIFASLLKYILPNKDNSKYWIVSISPCFDRKLEAVKLNNPDCVITTSELLDLIQKNNVDFVSLKESDISFTLGDNKHDIGGYSQSTSDGYAYHAAYLSAIELFEMTENDIHIEFKSISRSGDVQIATIKDKNDGRELNFVTAYGFRSLQSILRKIKNGQCNYDFIELMACPGGCTNGGGQIPSESNDRHETKRLLNKVNNLYFNDVPKYNAKHEDNELIRRIYNNASKQELSDNIQIEIKSRKDMQSLTSTLDW